MYNIEYYDCTVLYIQLHSIVHYCTILKARTILYNTKSYIVTCIVQYFMVLSNHIIPRPVTLHESCSSGFECKHHKPAQFSLRDEHCKFLLMVF